MTIADTSSSPPPSSSSSSSSSSAQPTDPGARVRPSRRPRRRRWLTVAAVVVAGLAVGLVAFRMFRPHLYSGAVMQAPEVAPSMDGLVLTDGTPVDLDAWLGDVVVVYFGYTHCPDICPTTLATLARAMDDLGGDADRVHVVLVTIDPERDTPESLATYVHAFDERFAGATGDLAAVERTASLYGVYFARGDATSDGYAVDHTATLMGIDTDGHLRIVWPNEVTSEALASDLDALL
jgi:protein SCO1/2